MTDVPVERRLAAILAADIAGYTRLMRADEAGTLDRVKKLRAEVLEPETAAQGGRIVKSMGDGFLIEFASAVAAARCALTVQAALDSREAGLPREQRIAMRIGIHVGEIILDGGDIFGDGVNVAARLEAIGEPGGIVLSGGAHELVAGRVEAEFEDLGERALKNIDTPVAVFRVRRDGETAAPEAAAKAEPAFTAEQPSIAVLPFDNLGGDPEQEVFADGLVEDIITTLSKLPALTVSPATPPSSTRAGPSTCRRWARSSACASCWRAACARAATASASPRS